MEHDNVKLKYKKIILDITMSYLLDFKIEKEKLSHNNIIYHNIKYMSIIIDNSVWPSINH